MIKASAILSRRRWREGWRMTRSCRRWGMQPSHPGAARRRCAEAQATHVKLFQYPDDACVVVFIPDDREVVKSGLRLPDDGAQDRVMGASPETAHGSGFVVQSVEKAGARSPLGEVHCESRRAHAAPDERASRGFSTPRGTARPLPRGGAARRCHRRPGCSTLTCPATSGMTRVP